MFQNTSRVIYRRNQIVNVVCQLRFPTILAVSTRVPDAFQDAVRKEFPRYQLKRERPAPKLVSENGTVRPQPQEEILNHGFLADDGSWAINLTSSFIALSTPRYTDWETFAGKLDRVVAEFYRIYQPACFDRVGLRYINAFSREELELEGQPWSELIQPSYLGLFCEDDVREEDFLRCTQDADLKARGGCRVRIHTGPGMVKRNGMQEKKARYILDLDVLMMGKVELPHLTGALQTVHMNADNIFRGAITDTLHDAMDPREP